MGEAKPEPPAALVCAILYREAAARDAALKALEADFGALALRQEPFPFTHSDYYTREMGSPLLKQIVLFREPVPQGFLAEIKTLTNLREEGLARLGRRRVNLDPGLLLPSRLVLATTKDHAHRIYLARGIYAEVTLLYRNGAFTPLPWTYPDYREPTVLDFLGECRRWYLARQAEERREEA
ncbi:MAG: DUF4416 family protein [Acidobacteriota bacterium]